MQNVIIDLIENATFLNKRIIVQPCMEQNITHILSLVDKDHVIRKKWLVNGITNEIVKEFETTEELYKHTKVLPPPKPLIKTEMSERVRKVDLISIVNGELRSTIHSHGDITPIQIGSASKRIVGAIFAYLKSKR